MDRFSKREIAAFAIGVGVSIFFGFFGLIVLTAVMVAYILAVKPQRLPIAEIVAIVIGAAIGLSLGALFSLVVRLVAVALLVVAAYFLINALKGSGRQRASR
jgi:hypothetical protein